MPLTDKEKFEYTKRIMLARVRILNDNCFYGLLLMHMKFGIDESCETAYTDGDQICFSPKFLDEISNGELDFVLMHEILHVALKHCYRGLDYDQYLFNIACDIVVNSNILKSNNMDISSITVNKYGVSMHLAPDKKEGFNYTAEEVYAMLIKDDPKQSKGGTLDDHSHWGTSPDTGILDDAIITICNSFEQTNQAGKIPMGIDRKYKELRNPKLNWREILNDFISYEVNDYSFTPPDRRYDDFFMPDFNDTIEEINKKLLFVVDTSASISEGDLTKALSEVNGALSLGMKLDAYLVTLDAAIYEPIKLEDADVSKIKMLGGGGTSFIELFKALDKISDKIDGIPDFIIFITDGECEFPKESARRNIPVLWIINNKNVTPPWGMVARI